MSSIKIESRNMFDLERSKAKVTRGDFVKIALTQGFLGRFLPNFIRGIFLTGFAIGKREKIKCNGSSFSNFFNTQIFDKAKFNRFQ